MEQQTGSKSGKECIKAVYCHPVYLTYMESTSWEMLDWKKHKLESGLPGEISITSDMQIHGPYGRKQRRPKSLLKEESEKVGLKLNIQKTKIMASGPITSWQIDGETVETVADFIFSGTADVDCSHEIKTLAPWKKSYDKLRQHIKNRDLTLPTKVHIVRATAFPVVTYGCESWTIKKAENLRIDAFKMWCWRRLLRVP